MPTLPFLPVAGLSALFPLLGCSPARAYQVGDPPPPLVEETRIEPRTHAGRVPIGGMTVEEAKKAVRAWWETERRTKLKLETGGKVVGEMSLSSLGLSIDDTATLEPVFQNGYPREEDGIRRLPIRLKQTEIDAKDIIADYKKAVPRPKPTKAYWRGGKIEIVKGTVRPDVDPKRIPQAAENAWRQARALSLPLEPVPPAPSLGSLQEVVAAFTTSYPASNRPRTQNLRLAAAAIDGTVLLPGETFSFNETVGERTRANGYRDATVFLEGRHAPGLAGGICQVSSTLYNAALLADMKVVERRNHSLRVPYVRMGRDATVYWGLHDLRFKNESDRPIALNAEIGGGRLTFRVIGARVPGKDVNIVLGRTRSHARGWSVETYRVVSQDGKVIRRDNLGSSSYRPEIDES